MVKMVQWLKRHLPTQRRLIQLYAALLYNAHVKGFIKGNIYTGSSKMICVPGLNCYSCPGAVGACPLGALQNAMASSGNRAPFYVIGILLLYGLILGRTICGFLCPMGLLQELLHKLPTPKIRKGRWTRILSGLKYVILAVFVIAIPLWYAMQTLPLPAFCKYICPAGTFEGAVGLLANPANADKYAMLGGLFTQKFLILLLITGLCIFLYRAFCRFLCPLGALYGMFAKLALVGVKVDMPKCIDCGRCVSKCQMDVRHVGDHECIHCGECIEVCPTKAITFKAGKITLHGPETGIVPPGNKQTNKRKRNRLIVWMAATVLLAGALIYFNPVQSGVDTISVQVETEQKLSPDQYGHEVGKYAPDFSAPLYGSDAEFVLSEQRGKKVVVNFWATWCTPCCSELPYFDEIHRKYGEQVTVVAVHSDLITDDVEAYLAKFDYRMPFAQDETGQIISMLGGSNMLPHTVILDEEGRVIYNAAGSLTYERLEALLGFGAASDVIR